MTWIISIADASNPTLLDAAIRGILQPLSGLIFGLVLFLGPLFILGAVANHRRKRYKASADDPFTDQPLRPPGESLRLRIEKLNEDFDEALLVMALTAMVTVVPVMSAPERARIWIGGIAAAFVAVVYMWNGRKLLVAQRLLWDCRLGFSGERVVGESLTRLLAHGYHVFHDLLFDDFNIDHVIVGPAGVFAVETKARRKPADVKGQRRAVVTFDGETLIYPKWRDTHGLEQARRNAATLSKMLTKATGEYTSVGALLVIPGWFVDRKVRSNTVTVLNEKEIRSFIPQRVAKPLSPERIQRIVYQLEQRCRVDPDPAPVTARGVA